MTEFRSRILQSKQHESSLIATSRKRKLRELYAVADCDGPIPLSWVIIDIDHPLPAPAPSPAETLFLENNDILHHRLFDESSLPTRRQLQSYSTKGPSSSRRGLIPQTSDPTRLSSKASRDDGSGKSGGNTPAKEPGVGTANGPPKVTERSRRGRSSAITGDKTPTGLRRTSSRSSQTNLGPNSDAILISSIDESLADGALSLLAAQEEPPGNGALEQERIENKVESRPGSPGIDPRKALPFSAEDAANLTEPLVNGSHEESHKAITAHLPPREIRKDHLREADEREAEKEAQQEKEGHSGNLLIKLPPPHHGRPLGDPMSSPGSTVDAHSATTSAMHDASTDTSPDNEGPRYEADRSDDKEPDPETPPELAPTREEVFEKEEHDRLLKAQIELARSEILAGSPTTADAQLRLEEEQAAAASAGEAEREIPDSEKSGVESSQDVSPEDTQSDSRDLTHSAGEIVQDIMDDEDDEVVGVPTPEDEKVPDSETAVKSPGIMVPLADSEAMDVDSAVTDDGSKSGLRKGPIATPAALETAGETADSSNKSSVAHKVGPLTSTATPPPRRTPPGPASTPPTLERMTTRVSSGAMRHKSVSEILGEIPRPNTISASERHLATKPSVDTESATESNSHSRATTPQSPASRMRTMVERAKEKERSKLSTVVFAKQPTDRLSSSSALVPSGAKAQTQESGDYFMPLILSQVYNATRGVQPLEALLMSAHKTITTSNSYIPYHEHQSHKVLRRIHSLQSQDKWSFRQPKRAPEPNRPTAHWDELLKEVKWMRTDFREERKWKMAVAKNLARACAEWVEVDEDDRKLLQVKVFIPPVESIHTQDPTALSATEVNHPTPDLENSAENDSQIEDFDEEPRASLLDAVAPTAMFSLGDDDVVFGLRRSPATDKLLEELPMYGMPLKIPQSELPTAEADPDASWRKPALPLSKYVEGKIVLKDDGPPRKRSRYEYEQEEEEDDQVVFGGQGSNRTHLEPAMLDVALFNPENKHIRDRIHAGHQFRPPSENPMPLQSFFECRSSSQWTWAEEDELKTLVREYSYNWQLISSMLSTRSLFASSAERRTPWECFERWIYLEGLPVDMQKTHYFRAYNNRLEAAARNLQAQAAQPPPQANAAGAAITPVRRRTTTSVRVERRRNQKHLSIIDAMRKLAKKRETSLQKQQHAAGLAAMRKANEVPQPQGTRHTPQDFSRLKHEREVQMLERMQRHQMQQEAAKRAMQQGRNGQQPNPQQYPNGASQQARNIANPNAGTQVNLPPNGNRQNQLAVPGQNLPHAQMQQLPNGMAAQVPLPNGHGTIPQIPLKGVPQAPMQAIPGMPGIPGMPSQHRMPAPNGAPDIRLVMQARQISEQQRQAVQMQQQGQNNQIHNSPPNMRANMNNSNAAQQAYMQNMQNNQAFMAAFNASNMNGVGTSPSNGLSVPSVGPAGSPRMGHPSQPQQPNGSISQISKLESQFRAQFPTASPEQIKKFVQDALSQNLAAQRQSAMHAAAGSGTPLPGMPGGIQNSPQQYAQMLRAQQERQAAAASQQPRSTSAGSGSGMGK